MWGRFGLGLRAQILLALSFAFIASFPLLGIAAVELTQRARAGDRVRDAEATARAIATAVANEGPGRRERFERMADSVVGHSGIRGVELERAGGSWSVGARGRGDRVQARAAGEAVVRMWVEPPRGGAAESLPKLLLLYVAVTGGAILLLVYVAMTYLIVRPVEAVTRASERLSEGRWSVEAPVRGGAEVARLGVSFNEMARQLRKERLALEQRLHELENTTAELASAQDQVVRSARLASVGRLSAGVAHEIGNPLSAILGLLEIVQGGELEEAEQREFLSRIQAETERIQKIIRDLLDFARQGSSEHEQQDAERTCDVREIVEDAVRLVAPQKDLRGVTIERRFADDAPCVRAVPDRLTQVVLNLLLNAADAIEGDGAIYVEVYRTGGEERPELLLAVEDTGPGIDPEVLEHLFEPFVTTKPTGYGTGLGLAVCYTIVERLGGSMHACNAERGGARFEIRLPAAEDAGEGGDG